MGAGPARERPPKPAGRIPEPSLKLTLRPPGQPPQCPRQLVVIDAIRRLPNMRGTPRVQRRPLIGAQLVGGGGGRRGRKFRKSVKEKFETATVRFPAVLYQVRPPPRLGGSRSPRPAFQ